LLGYVVFTMGLFITAAPYYVRSYLQYGNPVFPFASKIFNTPFGYLSEGAGLVGSNASAVLIGAGRGLWEFLLLPFNVTFHPELFLGDKIGFLFLPAAVLILFAWRQNLKFLFFCLLFTLCWFYLSQITRYLPPVLAIVAVMVGLGYMRFSRILPQIKGVVLGAILVLASVQSAWAAYHTYKDYFIRKNDAVIDVAKHMNAFVEADELALVIGDSRIYYYDFVAFREKTFRNFTRYTMHPSPNQTLQLLDHKGVRFILLASSSQETQSRELTETDFDAGAYFKRLIDAGHYEHRTHVTSPEGREYVLYERRMTP